MPVDKKLLELLVCPPCKAALREQENFLVCSKCARRYPVRDGIPVMIVEEAS